MEEKRVNDRSNERKNQGNDLLGGATVVVVVGARENTQMYSKNSSI